MTHENKTDLTWLSYARSKDEDINRVIIMVPEKNHGCVLFAQLDEKVTNWKAK